MGSFKFTTWLIQNGAEILPTTNDFEEIRFKGLEIGVKYKSGKFSNPYAKNAYDCYLKGKAWDGRPLRIGRKNSYVKEKKSILKRDGSACFYCGNLLLDDVSLEHLIPLTAGGLNILSNMVLTHEKCNNKMGNKPLIDKVNLAIKNRVESLTNNQ